MLPNLALASMLFCPRLGLEWCSSVRGSNNSSVGLYCLLDEVFAYSATVLRLNAVLCNSSESEEVDTQRESGTVGWRERERGGGGERQTDRDRERQRQRDRDIDIDRQTETQREAERD